MREGVAVIYREDGSVMRIGFDAEKARPGGISIIGDEFCTVEFKIKRAISFHSWASCDEALKCYPKDEEPVFSEKQHRQFIRRHAAPEHTEAPKTETTTNQDSTQTEVNVVTGTPFNYNQASSQPPFDYRTASTQPPNAYVLPQEAERILDRRQQRLVGELPVLNVELPTPEQRRVMDNMLEQIRRLAVDTSEQIFAELISTIRGRHNNDND